MPLPTPPWSTPTLPVGAVAWYVDPDLGSNGNPGTEISPFLTITFAMGNVVNARGDWILIKRGTVNNEGSVTVNKQGLSTASPLFISTYGTGARPRWNAAGFVLSATARPFVTIRSLAFYGTATFVGGVDTPITTYKLITIGTNHNNVTLEDCFSYGIDQVVTCNNGSTDIVIRGCDFNFNRSSSIYVDDVQRITIEYNRFDNLETTLGIGAPHYLYLQAVATTSDVIVRSNCFMREDGSFGNEIRVGCDWEDNYHLDTEVTFGVGDLSGPNPFPTGFTGLNINWNVVDTSRNSNRTMRASNVGGGEFTNNLIAHKGDTTFAILDLTKLAATTGVNDFTIDSNVIDQVSSPVVSISNHTADHSNIQVTNNDLQCPNGPGYRVVSESGTLAAAEYVTENNRHWTIATGNGQFLWNNAGDDIVDFNTNTGDPDLGGSASVMNDESYLDDTRTGMLYRDMIESLTPGTSTIADVTDSIHANDFVSWDSDYDAVRISDWVRAGWGMAARDTGGGGGPGPGGGAAIAANVLAMTFLRLTRLSGDRELAFTGTSATLSPKLTDNAKAIRVVATEDCRIVMGGSATATSTRLIAGKPEFLSWKPGADLSVIQDTSAGDLYVTELGVATS